MSKENKYRALCVSIMQEIRVLEQQHMEIMDLGVQSSFLGKGDMRGLLDFIVTRLTMLDNEVEEVEDAKTD